MRIKTLLSGEYDKRQCDYQRCMQEQAEPSPVTGRHAVPYVHQMGRKKDLQWKCWIIWTVMKQVSKSVTFQVNGENAYGYLKSEKGVHRLVRISPFNAAGKRQTSFVSCDVMPDIEEDVDVEIEDDDMRIDTYRSSGAGGQHINKTSSAIRITHFPTGIVVQCQNERSQHMNKDKAMQMLKGKAVSAEAAGECRESISTSVVM